MSDMNVILKQLRIASNFSQEDLGSLLGCAKSTVSMYERGERSPDHDTLRKYAKIFHVDYNYLYGLSDLDNENNSLVKLGIRPIKTKKFPMLGEIACGEPIFTNEEHETYIDISADIDADFCLTARGDSMINARIQDGDIVFIKKQPIVNNGEIAAVIIGDEATLKVWHYYPEEHKLVLNPENRRYAPLVYTDEELDTITCLGKAVYFMSKI